MSDNDKKVVSVSYETYNRPPGPVEAMCRMSMKEVEEVKATVVYDDKSTAVGTGLSKASAVNNAK